MRRRLPSRGDLNTMSFELDEYLARIGYSGSRLPTLSLLHALTEAHAQAIPFENLDVLLGRPTDRELTIRQ